jgi:hypothetical protein
MGELSAKYKLSEKGEVITVKYDENNSPTVESDEIKLSTKATKKRFLDFQKKELEYNEESETIFSFMSAIKNGNEEVSPLSADKESRYNITPKYRLDFNNIFAEDIYASEMEMLSGINLSEGLGGSVNSNIIEFNQKIFSVFEFIAESIIEIIAAEAIFTANELIAFAAGNNFETGVEESFHHSFGEWGTIDVTYLSKFLFRHCNYPNNKTRAVFDIDERISAFIVGFEGFINTERLVDFEKIFKNRNKNLINREVKDTYGLVSSVPTLNISGLLGASISYLADTIGSLTTSGMKQFYLLKRKFAHQSHWRSQELHKAKSDENDNRLENNFDYQMTRLSLYRFKFIAERMHVGLKLIKYYQQSATYDSHEIKENGLNRLALSKSGVKDENIQIGSSRDITFDESYKEHFKYMWEGTNSGSDRSQSTRLRALPQLFLMSNDFIKSQIDDGEFLTPDKSVMQNFAVSTGLSGEPKRLSGDLVKRIEKHLDNEYMPFYLHDLRTNEIISFHAFLDNISDSFSTEYTPHFGFGRAEEIKHYQKTTRSINFSFTVAATSKDDHDLMWFQINKIVAMCYPQWTKGTAKPDLADETIAFSQMPASSPMIRLRIGDIIKSNYSQKVYSRIENIQYKNNEFHINGKKPEKDTVISHSNQEGNKFLMPGIYKGIPTGPGTAFFNIIGLFDPDTVKYFHIKEYTKIEKIEETEDTYFELILEGNMYDGYEILADKYSIIESSNSFIKNTEQKSSSSDNNKNKKVNTVSGYADPRISSEHNSITKSFESAGGKGLAGFITSLSVDYNEMPWETAHKGSKAPMMVKLTIDFSPIHDISLGLDHSGMLRAPAYNVGRLNQHLFGEPTEDYFTKEIK